MPDQRGHGRTAEHGTLGLFASHQGWDSVVNDLASLAQHIGQQHPGAPLFLFGHSMGSYIVQAYLLHHSASLQGRCSAAPTSSHRRCTARPA